MIEPDLDDTHVCIKCSSTIVGIDNYIQHRKLKCNNGGTNSVENKHTSTPHRIEIAHAGGTTLIGATNQSNIDHTYGTFTFVEPEPSSYANKSEHGDKASKSLSDPYYLPYELGADVFFSSLQLQSVQSTSGPSATAKTALSHQPRHKPNAEHTEVTWIEASASSTEKLMTAIGDISGCKKPYEGIFKPLPFVDESLDTSDDEEEEVGGEINEDEDEFDPISEPQSSGGKWKSLVMHHSPPVVPVTHTGGKWKPENRPNLRMPHTQLTRLSPNWEEAVEDAETVESVEHPPMGHTKGKWIPGTKWHRLEYKEEIEIKRTSNQTLWCNICSRKLKNKHIYENHLKTAYHLKRAEPEQQLEKATLGDMNKNFVLEELSQKPRTTSKKRKRRANFVKCELCKLTMYKHVFGKHLISHYHFRRMQLHPGKSLRVILDNIHAIVLQAPFQCRPCRFYANTEETFLLHWSSPEHLNSFKGQSRLWCSFCSFECEDNNQMHRHLLDREHKEVILAINRSVPICITNKLNISCYKCNQSFRYNLQLRKHSEQRHPDAVITGTASDAYQNRFNCGQCSEVLRSKIALQRHEKHCHFILKYFCTICNLEFDSPCKARRHRKTQHHRQLTHSTEETLSLKSQTIAKKKNKLLVQHGSKRKETFDFDKSGEVDIMLRELSYTKKDRSLNTGYDSEQNLPESQTEVLNESITSKLKCKDCKQMYGNLGDLKKHRDTAHPLLCHICIICGQSFALAQALGRHSRNCRPKPSDETTQSIVHLINQIKEPTNNDVNELRTEENKSWSCGECNFRVSIKSELIFHQLHHTLGPISNTQLVCCPLCSKSFRKHSLRCHLRQHTDEKIFACNSCGQKFARFHNLKSHIKVLHSDKSMDGPMSSTSTKCTSKILDKVPEYQCDLCGKVFCKQYTLKRHITRHSEDQKCHTCSYEGCHYAAASKSLLKVHLNSHSKHSFNCDRKECNYVGKSSMHLKRHLQSHSEPNKLFSCEKCTFTTKVLGHLKRHFRSHTGEKPYKCPHCDFSTALLDNLRKHILKTNKHPGKFIYECKLCITGCTFKTNGHKEFQEHLSKAHTTKVNANNKNCILRKIQTLTSERKNLPQFAHQLSNISIL